MKKIWSLLLTFLLTGFIFAQQRQHKIVFDFTKGDTASFAMMMRQAKNLLNATGNAQLEIVCHGPGLDMVVKQTTTVLADIKELHEKFSVVFAACEATMRRRGIDKSQLLPYTITVPLANLEFSSKQQDGWSYIKAGW